MSGTPSVLPVANFHANQDAAILRKTLKGFVCHSKELFNIICARCNWQRQEIARTFNLMYGKNLIKKLKEKLSGAADDQKQRLLLALMEPVAVYDAKQLRKAMQGLRRKSVLIEVITSRTNKQMADIRRAYGSMFKTELEFDISRKTSGYFQERSISSNSIMERETRAIGVTHWEDALQLQ
ncbi:hypothetical protein Y032_0371g124 [Ancylostoma ceylanicum]|nr:hypothetical protein Y032_0371g124 [Ancylostoma ceylanicum]